MNISEKVQELLKSKKCKGMGQNEIAEKIGISPSVLSKLCSGNSKAPSADTVLAIAKYFNVSTDWLLGLSDNPTTDKATKSLCKTLGLSDTSIAFLQNSENKSLADAIETLIEQHLHFIAFSEQPCGETNYASYKKYCSILKEIARYYDLQKIVKNVGVMLKKDGETSVLIEDHFAKIDDLIVNNKLFFDEYEEEIFVNLKLYILHQCEDSIIHSLRISADFSE